MEPKNIPVSEDSYSEVNSPDCADKLAFDTRAQAESSAVVAEYQHGTKLKVYLCRTCGLWHLASV